jgi:hypothetical protein
MKLPRQAKSISDKWDIAYPSSFELIAQNVPQYFDSRISGLSHRNIIPQGCRPFCRPCRNPATGGWSLCCGVECDF